MKAIKIESGQEQHAASETWVVVASLYQARMLRFHAPSRKTLRLEEQGRIEAPISAGVFDRFSDWSESARQPYQARCRQLQEEYRRFARQLARWVQRLAVDQSIEQITVFAPAGLMQWLQRLPVEMSPVRVDLRTGNLMNTYDDKLLRHPDILCLLQANRADRQADKPPAAHSTSPQKAYCQSADKPRGRFESPWRIFSPIPNAARD